MTILELTRVKICGVTTLDDALACARGGADMLGLNFYPASPRYLPPERARILVDGLRAALGDGCPLLVGVFVNESAQHIARVMETVGLDLAQLSGDEPGETLPKLAGRAIKAIRPRSRAEAIDQAARFLAHAPDEAHLPALLLDAYHPDLYGGTGEQASAEVARAVMEATPRLLLAGGLTPDNVADRVRAICPWGVDVASGVEGDQPGRKDLERVRAFIAAARGGGSAA